MTYKTIETKVIEATHSLLDSIVSNADHNVSNAELAVKALGNLMSIDCFRSIIEDAIEDVEEGETVDVDALRDEAIKRGFYKEHGRDYKLGLFARDGNTVWATSQAQAERLLPGTEKVFFVNTKLARHSYVRNGTALDMYGLNPAPPEHLRYVGPLLPDGSVPQD